MIRDSALPLESRHARLRPPTVGFLNEVFDLASVGDLPWLWRSERHQAEGFTRSLHMTNDVQFMITNRRSDEPAGLISAYELDQFHGLAHVTVALLPGSRLRVWPLEGVLLFANYLFTKFNLRKLCGRSTEQNFAQLRSGADHFFEVEGCLRNHLILNGRYQDLYLAAVSEERWREVGVPLLERILEPASPGQPVALR